MSPESGINLDDIFALIYAATLAICLGLGWIAGQQR